MPQKWLLPNRLIQDETGPSARKEGGEGITQNVLPRLYLLYSVRLTHFLCHHLALK